MAPYIITFFISGVLMTLGTRTLKNQTKLIRYFIVFLAILVPSILAGLRDFSVGTDVLVYGNPWFNYARNYANFKDYVDFAGINSINYLYAAFNFIVSRFTGNAHWFYFLLSFIENIIVADSLYKNRDIVSVENGWLTYLFLFFNFTLNILRQSLALVILLWGFWYIRKQKLIPYLLVLIVATLCHSTAIIGIIPYLVYFMMTKISNERLRSLSALGVGIIFVAVFKAVGPFLATSDLVESRYSIFLNNAQNVNVQGRIYLLYLPILIFYFISRIKTKENVFFETIILVPTLMSIFISLPFLSRLSAYFTIYFCFAWPYVFEHGLHIKVKSKNLNEILLILYLLLYWIIIYGILNNGQTIPYIFYNVI